MVTLILNLIILLISAAIIDFEVLTSSLSMPNLEYATAHQILTEDQIFNFMSTSKMPKFILDSIKRSEEQALMRAEIVQYSFVRTIEAEKKGHGETSFV